MATAQSSTIFNKFRYLVAAGYVNCRTDTFKAALVTTGFTQNVDTQHGLADISVITSNLANSGVETLSNVAVTEDDTNDQAYVTSSAVTFTASGAVTAIGMIIYDDTPTSPQADPLCTYILFDASKTLASGDTLTVTPPASGASSGWWKM